MEHFWRQIDDIASIFSTDTIFVLGKGPSADLINPAVFANSLVIGLNDAERIAPADITIFHEEWVERSVRENGFRSRLYVCPGAFSPDHGKAVQVPYAPMANDGADVMMQRLFSDDFVIEEVMFLSALKIARRISELRGRKQTVYMVGFDFDATGGYSSAISRDFSSGLEDEKIARIGPQEFYFVHTLYMLRSEDIEIHHVGQRIFSTLTPKELDALFRSDTERKSGSSANSNLSIVAELTTNHFGDRHRLERLIRAAKAGGADYVKLQKRNVETFYSRDQLAGRFVSPFGPTFRDYRHALELDLEDFAFVDRLCAELEIGWFVSVLDEHSYRYLQPLQPKMIKLPSTISEHRDYLRHVAESFAGEIVLSTGMTDSEYEAWVLEAFKNTNRLYLLQCNSAYPTPLHDCSIGVIRRYRDLARNHPHIVPGYSSHDIGWLGSVLAVAAGAQMIEKHVKLGNTEWAHFDAVALDLTTSAFRDFVDKVREAELIVGDEEKRVNESEHHKYPRVDK